MGPAESSSTLNADDTAKSAFAKWLFSQGASTVLLFAIAASVGYYIFVVRPLETSTTRQDNRELTNQHAVNMKQARDDFRETLRSHDETIGRSMDGFSKSMDRFIDRMESNRK